MWLDGEALVLRAQLGCMSAAPLVHLLPVRSLLPVSAPSRPVDARLGIQRVPTAGPPNKLPSCLPARPQGKVHGSLARAGKVRQ